MSDFLYFICSCLILYLNRFHLLGTKHDHDGLYRTLQRYLRGVFSGVVSMVTCTKSVDGFTEHIVSRGRGNIFGHL